MANEYKTSPVYVPAQTGVMHHASRDRAAVDPDAKGQDRTVAKATEAPASQTVLKTDAGGEPNAKNAGSDGKPDLGPRTDPANLVRAQEIANREKSASDEAADRKKRAAVATAAEMVGAPEELKRLDENRDGRIDQLEVQHALRAQGEDTTYAALTHYQKTLGFGLPGDKGEKSDKTDKPDDKPEKMFADDIAEAEKAKLVEKQVDKTAADAEQGAGKADSPDSVPAAEPSVKIVV